MSEIMNIGNVRTITKIGDRLYSVLDDNNNSFTLTEAQIRSLPNGSNLLVEGTQLILG